MQLRSHQAVLALQRRRRRRPVLRYRVLGWGNRSDALCSLPPLSLEHGFVVWTAVAA